MPQPDFERLNRMIRESGADWVAGPTSRSRYTAEPDIAGIFGVAATPSEITASMDEARAFDAELAGLKLALPKRLDWRWTAKRRWVPKVRNQETCGTCVAFATCTCLESRLMIANKLAISATPDLSEAHLFFCGSTSNCIQGWYPRKAFTYAKTNGIGAEAAFPYATHTGSCTPIQPVLKAVKPRSAASITARKLALQKGPVVACLDVCDDFLSYRSGLYKRVSTTSSGQHALCVVGYDDVQHSWIARNSWGTGWGETGDVRIAYGQCGIDTTYPFFFSGTQLV